MSDKKKPTWAGYPILDEKHSKDLDLSASVHEFHHGHDRKMAEKLAIDEYKKKQHAKAAAHHLNGMKASMATGAIEDAKKHHAHYTLHIKALGHNEYDAVPNEVKAHIDAEKPEGAHKFKGHSADNLLAGSL